MKAISFILPESKLGIPNLRIVELPIPQIKEGEVLVRVHYAGLNNFDLATFKGERNRAIANALKKRSVISGIEMSGIAESDGESIKKGDRVLGYTHIWRGPFFHAEYVACPETKLAVLPENFSLDGAASIVGGALTSIRALEDIARLQAGIKILITGITGSVGVTGVQLATHLGAESTGICHSSQTDFALSQGASQAFAYDRKEMPKAENQFDLVFDAAASLSFSSTVKYLKSNGRYITTMPHLDILGFIGSLFSRRKWGYLMVDDTNSKRMKRLSTLISQGAFKPVIDSVYNLKNADDAFARQQKSGKRGKILINFKN